MKTKELNKKIDNYISQNWDDIISDISDLVKIPSYLHEEECCDEYPFGTSTVKALNCALNIANKLGYKTFNHKNMIGIADLPGKSDIEIGFISHVDVVKDGPGWKFNPFSLTYVNDYYIGRGILDDKGPAVLMLYAINFWCQEDNILPYSIRYLFGIDEETDMRDQDIFLQDFEEPKIIITPDADFPICYGEKGLMRFKIYSPEIEHAKILDIYGGVAENAVAGRSHTTIKLDDDEKIFATGSRLAHAINIDDEQEGLARIYATGRSAHAADPYDGIDSNAVLSKFLIEKNIGTSKEISFLKFISKIAGRPDGDGIGIDCSSEDLGKLTIVPSVLRKEGDRISLVLDIRYPECIDEQKLCSKIKRAVPPGCDVVPSKADVPFLINPNSCFINALADAYTQATGEHARRFTMGGATYARNFKCATSFGPLMSWKAKPAWVGTLHGPDEGISVQSIKEALKIYIYSIQNLMHLDLTNDDFLKSMKPI